MSRQSLLAQLFIVVVLFCVLFSACTSQTPVSPAIAGDHIYCISTRYNANSFASEPGCYPGADCHIYPWFTVVAALPRCSFCP